jgi:hypothetical protein
MIPNDEHPETNFIDPALLFLAQDEPEDAESTSRLPAADVTEVEHPGVPKITRLPEGIEVIEQKVGRAVGNWILQVRCQCGRRWFELSPVDATHCPRCGMYVYIDVAAGGGLEA